MSAMAERLIELAKAARAESERELDELSWFIPGQFAEFGVSDEADEFIAAASPDAILSLAASLQEAGEALRTIAEWDDSVEAEDCPHLRSVARAALDTLGARDEE